MIAALLLGTAVALALSRPRARIAPPPTSPRDEDARRAARRARGACAVAAVAAWWLLPGAPGVVVAAGVALAGPRVLAALAAEPSDEAELAAVLPLALELLSACLVGGAPPGPAVTAVAQAFPGPCGRRLERVASALALGSPPAVAWAALGTGRDAAGTVARALARAAEGGAPVAAAVQRVAGETRRRQVVLAHHRAARAGVLAVLPLGACFLPAFVLLGVVPAVLGLAGPLLRTLS